jgi:hypothetical protein
MMFALGVSCSILIEPITRRWLAADDWKLMEWRSWRTDKPIPMADAVRYRDGLIIALLAQAPLRPRNSAELEIDRDVIKQGDGGILRGLRIGRNTLA